MLTRDGIRVILASALPDTERVAEHPIRESKRLVAIGDALLCGVWKVNMWGKHSGTKSAVEASHEGPRDSGWR